ncbi:MULTISPECIES: ABC transporter permease [Shinella]|uniref:Autoinducer 2 import system permease protein LsrD n=1 Tax=Shinella lacus TaxID=2654216 RepID=A0ABT1R4N9_9HYPH|nr:ABC transporter permease [Shinella lacus]MCQ4630145.1 ABC transporter permease [Shinella lacus]
MAKLEAANASPGAAATEKWSVRRLFSEWRELGIIAALIMTVLVFTAIDPEFLSSYNLVNIVLQASVTAILAMAVTFVIITGGIDLSIGTALALSAVVSGLLMSQGYPLPVVVLGTLATGALAGLFNGTIITLSGITPFVVTLGSMSIFSGLALIVSGGQTVYGIPPEFSDLLAGKIGPIPTPIVIAFVVLVVSSVVMRMTKLGEYLIALGGAREVARLAGIKVGFYTAIAYVISSSLAAVGAMVTVGRLGAADPALGADLLLPAIAAAVMGGADLNGGEGSMLGAVIGALLIATLQAGLTFLNVQAFYQQVAIGVVIILALLSNRLQKA